MPSPGRRPSGERVSGRATSRRRQASTSARSRSRGAWRGSALASACSTSATRSPSPRTSEALGELGDVTGVDLVTREVPGVDVGAGRPARCSRSRDAAFDAAIVISTLEHVGRDNTQYGLEARRTTTSLDCRAARAAARRDARARDRADRRARAAARAGGLRAVEPGSTASPTRASSSSRTSSTS